MTDPVPQDATAAAPTATNSTARTPRRRQALMVAAGGVAALAGMGLAWQRQGQALHGTDTAATPAPDALWALKAVLPQGGQLDLATMRGKPLLINFWATWCAPCVREMPEIDRFHRQFGPRGWQVLGLAIDRPAPVSEFLARVKVGFPVALAGLDGTDLLHSLGNPQGGLPFTILVNAAGLVAQRKMGETHFDELVGWADKA